MRTTIALLFAALLSACGAGDKPEAQRGDGREETRSIRNTEAVGYAGDAIADKVDAALDANDQRRRQLDAELGE